MMSPQLGLLGLPVLAWGLLERRHGYAGALQFSPESVTRVHHV